MLRVCLLSIKIIKSSFFPFLFDDSCRSLPTHNTEDSSCSLLRPCFSLRCLCHCPQSGRCSVVGRQSKTPKVFLSLFSSSDRAKGTEICKCYTHYGLHISSMFRSAQWKSRTRCQIVMPDTFSLALSLSLSYFPSFPFFHSIILFIHSSRSLRLLFLPLSYLLPKSEL